MNIAPGTVAAIAASLMDQGEILADNSEIFQENWQQIRRRRVVQFVDLAWEIAQVTEARTPHDQKPKGKP